jgi:hypothetical protein
MKLSEFSDDKQLDELVGTMAKGIGAIAKGAANFAVKTTKGLDAASGTSSDFQFQKGPDGQRRATGNIPNAIRDKDYVPGTGDMSTGAGKPKDIAQAQREIQKAKQDMQAAIKAKEDEIRELKKQMADIARGPR